MTRRAPGTDPGPQHGERADQILRVAPNQRLVAAAGTAAQQQALELVHEPEHRAGQACAEGPGPLQRDDLQVARRFALEFGGLELDAVPAAVDAPEVPGAGEGDEPQVVADDVDAARERRRHDGFLTLSLRESSAAGPRPTSPPP